MTKRKVIKKAIKDYTKLAKLKEVKWDHMQETFSRGLCNYFGCHGYRLHWHKIPNRPQYAKSILSYGWIAPDWTHTIYNIDIIPQHLTGFKPRLRFLKTFKNLKKYLEPIEY